MKFLVRSGPGYVREVYSTSPLMISDRKLAKVFNSLEEAKQSAASLERCGLDAAIEIFLVTRINNA